MRILFLLTQDLESPSGLGRFWPLARELVRLGHSVRVTALHADFGALQQRAFVRDGVEIEYVAPMHVLKQGNQKRYYRPHQLLWIVLRATWVLSRAALTSPADVIFVAKPHPMNGVAGLLAKTLRHLPLLVDCDDYEAGSGRFSGAWQRAIIAFFEKRIPRHADWVTTHTHFMMENLVSWGVPREKIFYLPNGIDPGRFQPPAVAEAEAMRKKLGLSGKKVVAYIGSLSFPSHPVYLLMDAFAQIHAALPNSVLLIVGGGENLPDLQKQAANLNIEDAVCFTGRVPPADIPLYYALADVTVDPVHDDDAARGRSPLKMFESWICGVPFVTMDVGERAYLMGEPPAGVLVAAKSETEIVNNLLKILLQPDWGEEMIRLGYQRVEHFTWDRLAKNHPIIKDIE